MTRYVPLIAARGRDALLPSDAAQMLRYYHGTPNTAAGKQIVSEGVLRPGTDRDHPMAPVPGRVYMTENLGFALHHTVGAHSSVLGDPEMMQRLVNDDGRYGYLFVIDGSVLEDVVPDEDTIGEYLCAEGRNSWIGELFLDLASTYWQEIRSIGNAIAENEIEGYEEELASGELNEDEYEMIEGTLDHYRESYDFVGEAFGCAYPEVAEAGKFLIRHMDEDDMAELLEAMGGPDAAISARGAVPVAECWRFDKIEGGAELARRGVGAFFEIAERVC